MKRVLLTLLFHHAQPHQSAFAAGQIQRVPGGQVRNAQVLQCFRLHQLIYPVPGKQILHRLGQQGSGHRALHLL